MIDVVFVYLFQSSIPSIHTQVMNMFNMISIESSSAYNKSGEDKHGFRYETPMSYHSCWYCGYYHLYHRLGLKNQQMCCAGQITKTFHFPGTPGLAFWTYLIPLMCNQQC